MSSEPDGERSSEEAGSANLFNSLEEVITACCLCFVSSQDLLLDISELSGDHDVATESLVFVLEQCFGAEISLVR